MAGKERWTDTEKEALAAHFAAIPNSRLTELLNDRTTAAVRDQAHRMGLKKHPERYREVGRENIQKRWYRDPPAIET